MALATCTLSLDLVTLTGGPAYRIPFSFELAALSGSDAKFVDTGPVVRYTDDLGHLELDLIQGLEISVWVLGRRLTFIVPSEETANLADQLFPYISSVEVSVDESGEVGDVLTLSAVGTYSNGDTEDVTSLVNFASSDTNVASVSGRSLTLLSSGATTVTVSGVKSGSELPSPEDNLELPFLLVPQPSYTLGNGVTVEVS